MSAGGGRSRSGETALIARWFAPLASTPGAFGLRDDAALLAPPPGRDLVVTADTIVERVHFLDDPADTIARKALRVNLSDLAAKGAEPLGYLLSLGLPDGWTEDLLEGFASGLAADQATYGIALLGGDTVRTPERLTVGITAIGTVPAGTMVRRAGARPGDALVVTGTIGDAALGVTLRYDPALADRLGLSAPEQGYLNGRYVLPRPRSAAARAVRTHAHAAMDVSDGLVGDVGKLAAASGVRLVIDVAAVPLSAAAAHAVQVDRRQLRTVLAGGDDYEIAAAIPEDAVAPFAAACARAGVAATRVGRIEVGTGVAVTGADGIDLGTGAYEHF